MELKKSMRNNQQLKDEPAERRLASRIRISIYICFHRVQLQQFFMAIRGHLGSLLTKLYPWRKFDYDSTS